MDAKDYLDKEDLLIFQIVQNKHNPCFLYGEDLY